MAIGFQDPATPTMEGILNFHELMFLIIFIGVFVGYLIVRCVQLYDARINPTPDRVQYGRALEIWWTVIPALTYGCGISVIRLTVQCR